MIRTGNICDKLQRKQTAPFGPMKVGGLWGRRVEDTVREWSLKVNDDLLLDGFRSRPGIQAWIGEHVGKFTHGAIYVNEIVHSKELANKIDFLMKELIACQEEDGYLGTYLPKDRWTNIPDEGRWDLWAEKYCLLGLYAYYQITGSAPAAECAKKLILLLDSIYGESGAYNLNESDAHGGLASGSVLEPLMLWYELTGLPQAKALADRIVEYYWTESAPGTPHLLKNMTKLPYGLKNVASGKAYEMMSCFVGLTEYARLTGKTEYLDKVMLARDQISLYYRQLTGCMSEREWLGRARNLTEKADLENCVAFTWIQLNSRLYELTGEMRCIDSIEESAFNHLMQAISPDGSTWIYYSSLTGPKDITYWNQLPSSETYKEMLNINTGEEVSHDKRDYVSAPVTCCSTNGQRALGLVPQYACTLSAEGDIFINLLFDMEKTFAAQDNRIHVSMRTDFPRSADGVLTIRTEKPCKVYMRVPAWANQTMIDGMAVQPDTYFEQAVDAGETQIAFSLGMRLRLMSPGFSNRGKYALAYGPMLRTADSLPKGWDFDEIVLELPKDLTQIPVKDENGWPLLILPAKRVFAGIGEISTDVLTREGEESVVLRPYLFCGITEHNRRCAQKYEDHDLIYDRDGQRTEYRVTMPCVIVS